MRFVIKRSGGRRGIKSRLGLVLSDKFLWVIAGYGKRAGKENNGWIMHSGTGKVVTAGRSLSSDLTVFTLVAWWTIDGIMLTRGSWALRIC